jgi:hypothetical protein
MDECVAKYRRLIWLSEKLLAGRGCPIGYSDFKLFSKTEKRHIVLDQEKNSKNILEKAFFDIFFQRLRPELSFCV